MGLHHTVEFIGGKSRLALLKRPSLMWGQELAFFTYVKLPGGANIPHDLCGDARDAEARRQHLEMSFPGQTYTGRCYRLPDAPERWRAWRVE